MNFSFPNTVPLVTNSDVPILERDNGACNNDVACNFALDNSYKLPTDGHPVENVDSDLAKNTAGVSTSARVDTTTKKKLPVVKIFRRADVTREVNKRNLQKLVTEAKVIVTSDELTEMAAIEYLTCKNSDTTKYFNCILNLPVELFNKKLNANLVKSCMPTNIGNSKKLALRSSNSYQ